MFIRKRSRKTLLKKTLRTYGGWIDGEVRLSMLRGGAPSRFGSGLALDIRTINGRLVEYMVNICWRDGAHRLARFGSGLAMNIRSINGHLIEYMVNIVDI